VPEDSLRLKVAIQKSGRLTDASLELLVRCGLKYQRAKDQLLCVGENMPLDLLFVRDDDIPDLVQQDVCDLGLVGLNVVEEKRLEFAARAPGDVLFEVVRRLDFGRCRLSIAVPDGFEYRGVESLAGRRIATTYPHCLGRFLAEHGVEAQIVVLSGSVEIAPRLGRADVICDLIATGSTLAANHLREAAVVLDSQAVLIRTPVPVAAEKRAWERRLMMRIDGVEEVKGSKYIMLHAPRAALAEITRLLPGSEAPTVLPLDGRTDRVAIHAVCRENVFWETLEQLKEVGATSVLVLPVEKMLS
jgi:ATP phosphoribosyltransferase